MSGFGGMERSIDWMSQSVLSNLGGRKMRPPLDNIFKLHFMPKIKNNGLIPDGLVMTKVLVIRGKKVMIDRDLDELYGVNTKRLNEQVKLINQQDKPRPRVGFRRKDERG